MTNTAGTPQPTDAELGEFLAKNADAYRIESRLTFTQVFLDPSKRGEKLEADIPLPAIVSEVGRTFETYLLIPDPGRVQCPAR